MAASGVTILQNTHGAGLAAMAKRLMRLADAKVLIGVPAGKEHAGGNSVAQVAAWTEFGANGPERPFLRGGIRAAEPKLRRVAEQGAKAVAEERMSPDQALDLLGMVAVGEVKQYMAGPNFVPNAPSTIAKKGSSQPTIDTAQVRQEITHVVEHGGAP